MAEILRADLWFDPAGGSQRDWRAVMLFLLWILAVVLVVSGIIAIMRKELLWGVVLIIVGLLVGPGGVSAFG